MTVVQGSVGGNENFLGGTAPGANRDWQIIAINAFVAATQPVTSFVQKFDDAIEHGQSFNSDVVARKRSNLARPVLTGMVSRALRQDQDQGEDRRG